MAMPLKQPVLVEALLELEQRPPELLDHVESPHPHELFLECGEEPLGDTVALGAMMKLGLDSMPRKRSSCWKAWFRYCGPWSWRSISPRAYAPTSAQ
jgi:hypothetical protein